MGRFLEIDQRSCVLDARISTRPRVKRIIRDSVEERNRIRGRKLRVPCAGCSRCYYWRPGSSWHPSSSRTRWRPGSVTPRVRAKIWTTPCNRCRPSGEYSRRKWIRKLTLAQIFSRTAEERIPYSSIRISEYRVASKKKIYIYIWEATAFRDKK